MQMIRNSRLTELLAASALVLTACATADTKDGGKPSDVRDEAIETLQLKAGAPVTVEVSELGTTRVVSMTPRFPVATHATDPALAALDFLSTHHDVFQMTAADAGNFVATRVDVEPRLGVSHVTLQRTFNGIAAFQGAITVHMDGGNAVFRALGDEFFHVAAPVNRMMLSPTEAATAAGRALGVALSPTLDTTDGQTSIFSSPGTLDPVRVAPRIFQVAPGDDRLAFQVQVSWLDDQKQQQYQLALVDAQDGALLASYSLVNTFTGRVFNVNAQPTATQSADTRTVVSFDGDPTASPQGWVGAARNTVGNNAVAATDLDGNNTVGANETQPVADASNSFDFPYSGAQDASTFKAAAVANAFFLVNDHHDRTYALGFTEASGNFQTNNFGKGGAQNDPVNVDAQDGSGTNNANFATPPDGSRPRMQMFLFNIKNGAAGVKQDGDFDPTVVYHENTHGLSNRLVGGGSTGCLGGIQSGGMGEGWSDWVAATFLDNPVIGAYVTGNATIGIRRASMANSPFTYANIKDGTMTEVHNAGEIWAATLWDARKTLGAAVINQLVVSGMKLTPCNPTMLQARDGIIQADANINAGANKCKLWTAFAGRQMGTGASSANHNSTSAIVLSTAVPADCGGGGTGTTRNFISTDVPKAIPDNNATGVRSVINVATAGLDIKGVTVDTNITHTFRGDLVIQVIAPNGQIATLSNRAGGSADNFIATGTDITASFTAGSAATGQWQLFVRDLAAVDVGTINSFALHVTSTN
jgi:subtilisin-like proprotein convertase family protein/predicted small secreted protein